MEFMELNDLIERLDCVKEQIDKLFSGETKQQLKTAGLIREFDNLRISKVEFIQKQILYIKSLLNKFDTKMLEGTVRGDNLLLEETKKAYSPQITEITEDEDEVIIPVEEIITDCEESTYTRGFTTIKNELDRLNVELVSLKDALLEFLPQKGTSVEEILDNACVDIEKGARQEIAHQYDEMAKVYYRLRSELAIEEVSSLSDLQYKFSNKNTEIEESCEKKLKRSLNDIYNQYYTNVKDVFVQALTQMHLGGDQVEKEINLISCKADDEEIPRIEKLKCDMVSKMSTKTSIKAFIKAAIVDPTKFALIFFGSFIAYKIKSHNAATEEKIWIIKKVTTIPEVLEHVAILMVLIACIQVLISVPKEMKAATEKLKRKEVGKLKLNPKYEDKLLKSFKSVKKNLRESLESIIGLRLEDYKYDSDILRPMIKNLQESIEDAIAPVDNVLKHVNIILEKQ